MSFEINKNNISTSDDVTHVKKNTVRQVTQILYESCVKATISATALAIAMAFVYKNVIPIVNIQIWLGLFFSTYIARLIVSKRIKRALAVAVQPEKYLKLFRTLTTLCGLVWGSAGVLLFSQETAYQCFLAITTAGVGAAATSVYVVDKRTHAYFLASTITPLIPNLLLSPNSISLALAIAMIVFGVYSFAISLNNGKKFQENIKLRFEEQNHKETIFALAERHRLHIERTPLAVIEWDNKLAITFWNAAAEKMFGFTAEQAIGSQASLFVTDSHLDLIQERLQALIHGQDIPHVSTENLNKSGETIYCEWFNTPLHDSHGNINGIASLIQDQTAYIRAQKEIEDLAYLDSLTHLANRRLLMNRLDHAITKNIRKKTIGGLIFIDIDKFKWLNDHYGHRIGDLLLCEIATRLKKLLRGSDTVSRLGGDEFVLLIEEISANLEDAQKAAQIIAEKVIDCIRQPFDLGHLHYHCTASIGIALFDWEISGPDEVIRRADTAMYQSKHGGKNAYQFYDENLQSIIDSRDQLTKDLQPALSNKQFKLHFQPQVDISKNILGAEVLLRWPHPVRGNVSPAEFIPLAEESRIIVPIGNWVLAEACQQLKKWQRSAQTKHLTLSVNVSAMQFSQSNFVEQVTAAVKESKCDPSKLILELTESAVLHQVDDVIQKMLTLKKLGITFSMDDFGVGHSSLSVLKRLPLDELKIDRSFVVDLPDNEDSATIALAIIAMGNSLRLKIIAEGIENQAQASFLTNAGCKNFQGYFYGKPVALEDFVAMLPAKDKSSPKKKEPA